MTHADARTTTALLYVRFATEANAPIDTFSRTLSSLQRLLEFTVLRTDMESDDTSYLDYMARRSRTFQIEHRSSSPSQVAIDLGYPFLAVRRMNYGSPWEVALSAAVSGTPVAVAGGVAYGALRGLRELLEMKMTWDRHRIEVAGREIDNEERRQQLATRIIEEFRAEHPVQRSRDRSALTTESDHRLLGRGLADLPDLESVEDISEDDPRA